MGKLISDFNYEKDINELSLVKKYINSFFVPDLFVSLDDYRHMKNNLILPERKSLSILHIFKYIDYFYQYNDLLNYIDNLDELFYLHNRHVLERRVYLFNSLNLKVEGHFLNREQIEAIVKEDDNVLVVSGPGTGKTTTIIGKIKYLIQTDQAKSDDILVLSLTSSSCKDLEERIKSDTKKDIKVITFNHLAKEIVKSCTGNNIRLYSGNMNNYLKELILEHIKDKTYLNNLIYFILFNLNINEDEMLLRDLESYKSYYKAHPPITLKNETVSSYGELVIANYLYINGIDYEYSPKYLDYISYRPSFRITGTNTYIEYFGLDKNDNLVDYFDKDYIPVRDKHNNGLDFVKEIHKRNKTKLIDLYLYESVDGSIINSLKTKLEKDGIKLNNKLDFDIWTQINYRYPNIMDYLSSTFETVINLIKSNNYEKEDIEELFRNYKLDESLIMPIFKDYNKNLSKKREYDYNDVTNMATKYILNGHYKNKYKFIIVDEYQDINKAKYNMLYALKLSKNFKLFSLGDDWQSIYKSTSSDINLITNYNKYFKDVNVSKLVYSFRLTEELANISEAFIMKNPSQIKKDTSGLFLGQDPIEIINYNNDEEYRDRLKAKLDELPHNSKIFLLGRYIEDLDVLKNDNDLVIKYDNKSKETNITYKKKNDLKIKFLTIHRCKGLESDYVFILNNRNNYSPFPNKVKDIPVIELLTDSKENYLYAEERRLFYVALTRAEQMVYLMVEEGNESYFVDEIRDIMESVK